MMRVRDAAAGALAAAMLLTLIGPARADDPGLVSIGAGAWDFDHNRTSAEGRVEYRFSQGFFFIKPLVGVLATNDGEIYAYGGLRADLIFADHYVVMPVATVGYYDKGYGKNLGSWLEFKTGAEFAYRFDNAWRVGIAFDHISNAGLTRTNPGTENILLVASMPLGF
ncbi:MAG TPA: acyloxyacyl hydrolase [Stellaceae bacterium]|nr:acyloxyacyl hydrolase [Stellaceae bacterium]